MVSVCTVPARGGRSYEHFGGYKTINGIPLCTVEPAKSGHSYQNLKILVVKCFLNFK